jgi:hypothetical protein
VAWEDAGGGVVSGGTDNAILRADGTGGSTSQGSSASITDGPILFLNSTVNTRVTIGVSLDQGANDNEILAVQSSDVGHTMLNTANASTFGSMRKFESCAGGLRISGYQDAHGSAITGLDLAGFVQNCPDTAKTTGARGVVSVSTNKHANCSSGPLSQTDSNMLVIRDEGTSRFIFDVEGSAYSNVEWTTYDDYCDIELLRGVHGAMTPCYAPTYKETFGRDMVYNVEKYEDLKLVGKDSMHWETREDGRIQLRGMVNFTGLTMLHHSTILQMADRFNARLDGLETQLKALTEGK